MNKKTYSPETEGFTMDRWASFYDLLINLISLGREAKLRDETVTLAGIQPGERVLDVGCGTGSLAIAAAKRLGGIGAVAGIDPAPRMIEVARKKAVKKGLDVDFRVGLIEDLPFEDDTIDVILSSLMMHHLPDHLKRTGMVEAFRVLKPGGRLAIVELDRSRFSLVTLVHGTTTQENRLALQLKGMMVETGFGEIDIKVLRALTFLIGVKA